MPTGAHSWLPPEFIQSQIQIGIHNIQNSVDFNSLSFKCACSMFCTAEPRFSRQKCHLENLNFLQAATGPVIVLRENSKMCSEKRKEKGKRGAVNYIAGRALGRKVQWQVSSVSSSSHWVITRSMKVAHSPRLRPNKIEGTREQRRKGSFILGTWSYTGSSSFFVYYVYNESMLDYIFYILILIIKQNWTLSPFY